MKIVFQKKIAATSRRTNYPRLLSCVVAICLFSFLGSAAKAQSNYKEATNNFALYTQTGNIKHLETAKKFIDQGFKTRRDTNNTKNIVLRSMIYSSLAYADSSGKINDSNKSLDEASKLLNRLSKRDLQDNAGEVNYIKQNLAASYIYLANKDLNAGQYNNSYNNFLKVAALQPNNDNIIYNLGLLANQTGNTKDAIAYYNKAIALDSHKPIQYLELADIYTKNDDTDNALKTLQLGRQVFPDSKEILFKLITEYAAIQAYDAILPIIDEAIKYEPENVELNYLAGFTFENAGDKNRAKEFYLKANSLDDNNYEANLALGLMSLESFLKDINDQEAQVNAENYLLKANEIKPHEINALKSLAIYYERVDDYVQLDRVNRLLNNIENDLY